MVAVLYYTRTDLISRQGKVSIKSDSMFGHEQTVIFIR